MKPSKSQVFAFCERLGNPFLFLEERELIVQIKQRQTFINVLPKILFILEGSLIGSIDSIRDQECHAGKVLINLKPTAQNYRASDPNKAGLFRVLRLTFAPELIEINTKKPYVDEEFLGYCLNRLPAMGVIDRPKTSSWDINLGQIRQELLSNQPNSRHRIHSLARNLLLELADAQTKTQMQPNSQYLIEKINTFLESNISQQISLDNIAQALDRSGEHLARQYKRINGHTIFTELKRRRIEKAKYYLLCTDWQASKIAHECGFSTPALFSRSFHQSTGLSPRSFRDSRRLGSSNETVAPD